MILYECLTGRLPYTARTPAALMIEIRRARPPSPRLVRPEVPSALDAAVMKAIAPDRAHRFGDALEMQRCLAALAHLDDDDEPTTFCAPRTDASPVAEPESEPVQVFARKV
jgi:serine/threonine protein kinase